MPEATPAAAAEANAAPPPVADAPPPAPDANAALPADAKPPEAAKPDEPKKPEPTERERIDAQRFAAVAKKEKALLEKDRALKAREEAVAKAQAEKDAEVAKLRAELDTLKKAADPVARKTNAKLNPLKYLEDAGLTPEDINQYVLSGGQLTPDAVRNLVQSEADRVRAELAEKEKAAETQRKAAEEAALKAKEAENAEVEKRWATSTVDFVNSHEADYPLTTKLGLQNDIPALIRHHYESTQQMLSAAEAAAQYEANLEKLIENVLELPKVKAKYEAKATVRPPTPGPQQAATDSAKPPRTLTNDFTRSTPSAKPGSVPTDAELIAAAEATLKATRTKS